MQDTPARVWPDDCHVRFTVKVKAPGGGSLLLRSRARRSNEWTEIPIPGVSVTGPDTRACLHRSFITKALRFGLTEIEVQGALSPVVFTAPGKKMVSAYAPGLP